MMRRPLGRTGLMVSPIGFGAFKIGRNEKIKYARGYALPSAEEVARLLNGVLDLGINLIDTAPAYGISEERIGRHIAHRRKEYILSSKAGETFEGGRSIYDFSRQAVIESAQRSLRRLRTDVLDVLLVHSDGNDARILNETDCVEGMRGVRERGMAKFIGFSGKTPEGARMAMDWADVIMVEYHAEDRSHAQVIAEAGRREVGVMIKKPLASGRIEAKVAIPFLLSDTSISTIVIGGLSLEHIRGNVEIAERADAG